MKKKITKWIIHLTGSICIAGTIVLLITFCSEVLFSSRGELDQTAMTWEDFYGPVLTTLFALGFLFLPFEAFSFRNVRVWLGAIASASGLTAATYVMVAPIELSHFHSENFIIAIGLLSFTGFLCLFAGIHAGRTIETANT